MPIVYPRDFPVGASFSPGSQFRLPRIDFTAAAKSGAVATVEAAAPVWVAEYRTTPLNPEKFSAWQAWLESLRGGQKRFWGYHPMRQHPLAYGEAVASLTRAGGGAFDGTAAIQGAATAGLTLAIKTLPASYQFKAGDMLAYVSGSNRALHRVTTDVTANGSGVVTVDIEPRVILPAVNDAVVYLVRPPCLMMLDGETDETMGEYLSSITFRARQVLVA